MKRLYPTVVLTGMLTLALGLSACSSWRNNEGARGTSGMSGATSSSDGSTVGATSGGARSPESGAMPAGSASMAAGDPTAQGSGIQSGTTADQTGALGAQGTSGASGTSGVSSDAQDQTMQRSAPPPVASTTPNSTVISIEPLASGSSGSSASGTSGTSGSAAGGEQAYRVTLRMDDGSTQVVSQGTPPSYRSGDRVNLSGGIISR